MGLVSELHGKNPVGTDVSLGSQGYSSIHHVELCSACSWSATSVGRGAA